MFKQASLLFFHAETGLHAGSGQSLGIIDLAIQRERTTDYPVVAASGVKGAVRDWFSRLYPPTKGENNKLRSHDKVVVAFGPDTENASDHAGAVAVTDARLLLFPVRSARGVFAWATSPTALARFRRDLALAGRADLPNVAPPDNDETVRGGKKSSVKDAKGVLLEEYAFTFQEDAAVDALATWLAENAVPKGDEYQFVRETLAGRLLMLSDNAFRDFVVHATEVQARVKLAEGKSTDVANGGNLFYQENLPADAVLYAVVLVSNGFDKAQTSAQDLMAFVRELDGKRIQIGGDETIGKGICSARFLPTKA